LSKANRERRRRRTERGGSSSTNLVHDVRVDHADLVDDKNGRARPPVLVLPPQLGAQGLSAVLQRGERCQFRANRREHGVREKDEMRTKERALPSPIPEKLWRVMPPTFAAAMPVEAVTATLDCPYRA
jgi:hypothetical protein